MNKCKEILEQYNIIYRDYKHNQNIYNSLKNKALCRNGFRPQKEFKILSNKSTKYYKKLSNEILITTELLKRSNNNIKDAIVRSVKK
jgi:hypothetical protein